MTLAHLQRPTMPFTISEIISKTHDEFHEIYIVQTDAGKLAIKVNVFKQVMGWMPA